MGDAMSELWLGLMGAIAVSGRALVEHDLPLSTHQLIMVGAMVVITLFCAGRAVFVAPVAVEFICGAFVAACVVLTLSEGVALVTGLLLPVAAILTASTILLGCVWRYGWPSMPPPDPGDRGGEPHHD